MGKRRNKQKAGNVSGASKELPSEGKPNNALKPEAKIAKTPIQNKSATKGPKITPKVQGKSEDVNISGNQQKAKTIVDKNGEGKNETGKKDMQKVQKDKKEKNHMDIKGMEKNKTDTKEEQKVQKYGGRDQIDQESNGKLGGLIFMCNAKTKPDCFRYMVMGFPDSRKDLVLSIKPDLKLFLYDYDLRLLYGIYKAASAGGMRLEPAAFNGSFSAQVRFKVDKDCKPLSLGEFRDTIKENYDGKKNMFKCELSVQQVKKLTHLFCTRPVHSNVPALTQTPQTPFVSGVPLNLVMPLNPVIPLHHVVPPRPVVSIQGISYQHQGNLPNSQRAPPQEDRSHDRLALSVNDYLTYGLRKPVASALVPPPVSHSAATSLDHYRGRLDSYHPQPYGTTAPPDPYAAPFRNPTEAHMAAGRLPPVDQLREYHGARMVDRSRVDDSERLHSAYAATALSDYNRRQQQPGSSSDVASLPVSSRYSFAGPTLSYR